MRAGARLVCAQATSVAVVSPAALARGSAALARGSARSLPALAPRQRTVSPVVGPAAATPSPARPSAG